jgi:hypothetical protein
MNARIMTVILRLPEAFSLVDGVFPSYVLSKEMLFAV